MIDLLTMDKKERGQSLTEFAIGFSVLILLIAGIVDIGRAFFTYMALNDAAQEGALYGSLNPANISGIKNRVQGIAAGPIDMSQVYFPDDTCGLGTSSPCTIGPPCTGRQLVVEVAYDFQISMPFIGAIIGAQSFPIHATVIDYILSPPCPDPDP